MDSKGYSSRSILLTALGFIMLVGTVMLALWLSVLQQHAARWAFHTLQVENQLGQVARFLTQAESANRGYLIARRSGFLEAFRDARGNLIPALDALESSVTDNAEQRADAARLRDIALKRMALLDISADQIERGLIDEAYIGTRDRAGGMHMREFGIILRGMAAREERLLTERAAAADREMIRGRIILVLSALLIVALAIVSTRDARRRMRALTATIVQLNRESAARSTAQKQVQQLQKMEAVGQLTGGIAHDFNNMLAIIVGSLDLARRRLDKDDKAGVARSLDHAQEGADRATALTAQLLAFARRQPLEPRTLEPNRIVSGISELLRRTLGDPIQIETVLAGGLWRVHADPEQLQSALINLAVNARDAMPDGGKLTIETANTELDERYASQHDEVEPGQYVMFSVTDTGQGMTPDVVEQAFEPFFTTKVVGRGTGLGLSQVFGFVKQSAGHVKIYSEPGGGTTVKIYLPRHVGEASPPVPRPAETAMPVGRPEEIILVVEDEQRVRRMSVDTLRDLGYSVIEAEDGHEALDLLARHGDIRLLFTDIMMPGMSGRQLADAAIAERPGLRVLYTTGYTRNAIVHNGVVDYGVAFLQKPFTIQALARKIREVLDEAE